MTTAIDAKSILDKILTEAEANSDSLRMVRTIEVGQWVRQGDVYLRAIQAPALDTYEPIAERQLAPGTTKGSRHIAEGNVTIYRYDAPASPLLGPVVCAHERFTVTHPEHAHVSLPSGWYQVLFQRDFAQEELARVAD